MTLAEPNSGGQYVELEHSGPDNITLSSTDIEFGSFYSLGCYNPVTWKPTYVGVNQTTRLECFPRLKV